MLLLMRAGVTASAILLDFGAARCQLTALRGRRQMLHCNMQGPAALLAYHDQIFIDLVCTRQQLPFLRFVLEPAVTVDACKTPDPYAGTGLALVSCHRLNAYDIIRGIILVNGLEAGGLTHPSCCRFRPALAPRHRLSSTP